jgi:MOSC domain-containing protein YiiM
MEVGKYQAAVASAQSAPLRVGTVEYLMNRPAEGVHVPVEELTLDVEAGIVGDRWRDTAWLRLSDGGPDRRVQVSVTNTNVVRCFTGDEPDSHYRCGDNLYVDLNLTVAALPVGSRILVGEAVLEVSDVMNDACGKFAQRFGGEALQWVREPEHLSLRLRGLFCLIVRSGRVRRGDLIELI